MQTNSYCFKMQMGLQNSMSRIVLMRTGILFLSDFLLTFRAQYLLYWKRCVGPALCMRSYQTEQNKGRRTKTIEIKENLDLGTSLFSCWLGIHAHCNERIRSVPLNSYINKPPSFVTHRWEINVSFAESSPDFNGLLWTELWPLY